MEDRRGRKEGREKKRGERGERGEERRGEKRRQIIKQEFTVLGEV